jgi:hypothetical protein
MNIERGNGIDLARAVLLEQENDEIVRREEFLETPIGKLVNSRLSSLPEKIVFMSTPR